MEIRLQKILSQMGIASRRATEELISEGRVTVNGKVAVLGTKADPERDHIKLDGKLLRHPAEHKVYYVLNKPRNVLTTLSAKETRTTVGALIKSIKARVYPVGRLDFDSEGLLLITNDGDLAHALTHPSKKVPKTYKVKVKGVLEEDEILRLQEGLRLEDGMTLPAEVRKVRRATMNSWLEITIREGRKRQVRRMFRAVGHPVLRLQRISIGGLKLGPMQEGDLRRLSNEEVKKLKYSAGIKREEQ